MKTYGGLKYRLMHSLTLALNGGRRSASCPSHFTPKERAYGTHWIGGWVALRANMDVVLKRKIPSPCQESNPDHPAHSQSLYRLSYPESLNCITIWYMVRSFEWLLSFRFSYQNFLCILMSLMCAPCPTHLILLDLIT
jgi:hypothetical protein